MRYSVQAGGRQHQFSYDINDGFKMPLIGRLTGTLIVAFTAFALGAFWNIRQTPSLVSAASTTIPQVIAKPPAPTAPAPTEPTPAAAPTSSAPATSTSSSYKLPSVISSTPSDSTVASEAQPPNNPPSDTPAATPPSNNPGNDPVTTPPVVTPPPLPPGTSTN